MKIIKVKAIKREQKNIYIDTPFIKLDSFLKLCDVAGTGGQAKMIIQNEEIEVNGEVCTMRGKKIVSGDVVNYDNFAFTVCQK